MLVLSILLKKKKLATLADKIAEVISVVFNVALIQLKWVFDNLIGYKTVLIIWLAIKQPWESDWL